VTTITILVVDDDAAIRNLILDVLETAAFRVLTAATGAQALVESEAEAGPIDLLLTDVLMPDVSGPELFRRLRTRRPAMRVLYMTGLDDSSVDDPAWFDLPVIHKPFTVANLFAAVREALV
jgi:DNA-binding response OmpR family regulator